MCRVIRVVCFHGVVIDAHQDALARVIVPDVQQIEGAYVPLPGIILVRGFRLPDGDDSLGSAGSALPVFHRVLETGRAHEPFGRRENHVSFGVHANDPVRGVAHGRDEELVEVQVEIVGQQRDGGYHHWPVASLGKFVPDGHGVVVGAVGMGHAVLKPDALDVAQCVDAVIPVFVGIEIRDDGGAVGVQDDAVLRHLARIRNRVPSGSAIDDVVAFAAFQNVVAAPAADGVVAAATGDDESFAARAEERVVPGVAQGRLHVRRRQIEIRSFGRGDHGNIVALATVNESVQAIEHDDIVARPGRKTVRAVSAHEDVVACTAGDGIVSGQAIQHQPITVVGRQGIIAHAADDAAQARAVEIYGGAGVGIDHADNAAVAILVSPDAARQPFVGVFSGVRQKTHVGDGDPGSVGHGGA